MTAFNPILEADAYPLELERVDFPGRVRLYALDDEFADGLELVGRILDPSIEELCGLFWDQMLEAQSIRLAYPADAWPEVRARSAAISRRKLQRPFDQDWAEMLAQQGDLCTNHQLPGRVLIAGLSKYTGNRSKRS